MCKKVGTSACGAALSAAGPSAAGPSAAGPSASQGPGPSPEEVKFTTPSPLDTHKKMSTDAENLNNLQNKVTELFKLKDKVIDINKNLL